MKAQEARKKVCLKLVDKINDYSPDSMHCKCMAGDCMAWVPIINQESKEIGSDQKIPDGWVYSSLRANGRPSLKTIVRDVESSEDGDCIFKFD